MSDCNDVLLVAADKSLSVLHTLIITKTIKLFKAIRNNGLQVARAADRIYSVWKPPEITDGIKGLGQTKKKNLPSFIQQIHVILNDMILNNTKEDISNPL